MERYVKERLVGAAVLVAAGIVLIPEMLSGPKDWRERSTVGAAGEADGTLKSYSIDLTKRNDAPARSGGDEQSARPGAQQADGSSASGSSPDVRSGSTPSPDPRAPASNITAQNTQPPQKETSLSKSANKPLGGQGSVESGSGYDAPPSEEADALPRSASVTSTKPAPTVARQTEKASKPAAAVSAAPGGKAWAVQIASYATAVRAQKEAAAIKEKGFDAFVMPFKVQDKTLYRVRVGPAGDRSSADSIAARLRAKGLAGAVVKHP